MKTELKAKFIQQILSKKKDNEGFTLIELLVVIIIIGILSAIALPSFINQAAKAKQTEAKTTVSSINKGQQTKRIEEGLFATSVTALGIGLNATFTGNYTYAVNATGGSADAVVVSHTHSATSTSAVTDPGHDHDAYPGNGTVDIGAFIAGGLSRSPPFNFNSTEVATTGITVATTTTNATAGVSGTNANLPPYYALCYIMKT